MSSLYTQDISRTFDSQIGHGGLDKAAFARYCAQAWDALQRLRMEHEAGGPLLRHAFATEDLELIQEAAFSLASKASQIFLLGTGGSSLGAKTLSAASASDDPILTERIPSSSTMAVIENADPRAVWMSQEDDLDDMAFIVVSKSGSTAETLALFAQCWSLMAGNLGETEAAQRFLVITGSQASPLRRIATRFDMANLGHEPDVVGRMSILSNVGLLPATIDWIDGREVRAGAHGVAENALTAASVEDCAPALGAALQVGLIKERQVTASVMMPYADQLSAFSRWYCQLWAESLGKDGQGSMPYPAMGTSDQHSQLQLWLNGPAIGVYTLIDLAPTVTDPIRIDDPDLAWMNGRTLGQMMASAARATADTLAQHGRPVRRIRIQDARVEADTIGALAQHFLIETVLAGYMLGVDPYTQPAVDTGKALMREYLSKFDAE